MDVEGVEFVGLRRDDIVRSDLVMRIVDAYENSRERGRGLENVRKGTTMPLRKNGSGSGGEKAPTPERRVDEFHRESTRSERMRAWVEGRPKRRIYITLLVITWVLLTALISFDSRTLESIGIGGRSYQVGDIARRDVYAPSTVTYVDPVATDQARQQAADSAPESYRQDGKVPDQVSKDVKSYFDTVGKIRSSDASTDQKTAKIADSAPFYLPEQHRQDTRVSGQERGGKSQGLRPRKPEGTLQINRRVR